VTTNEGVTEIGIVVFISLVFRASKAAVVENGIAVGIERAFNASRSRVVSKSIVSSICLTLTLVCV
jgi:hypothetical protein